MIELHNPKVSVVMTVYNGEKYLKESIASILNQTFENFDFIIVNDGSTDKTLDLLKSYQDGKIKIINQNNQGPPAAANNGIKASTAEYIARLDADDIASPERLDEQIKFLDHNKNCILVGGYMEYMTEEGEVIYLNKMPLSYDEIKIIIKNGECPFLHSSVAFRKATAIKCGLYNPNLFYFHDPDLYRKLAKEEGEMVNLPICLGKLRITPSALSNQTRREMKRGLDIYLKSENNDLSDEDLQFFKGLISKRNSETEKSIYFLRIARAYLEHTDEISKARFYLWQAVNLWHLNWPAWFSIVKSYLPVSGRKILNKIRRSNIFMKYIPKT